jgi:nucleotide-binding universal stress UspA family protein
LLWVGLLLLLATVYARSLLLRLLCCREFFIGSVTNYACHHCKQPVLVLHCD